MTTKSEIKKWVRPFVESRNDVVLEHRAVFLKPIHHLALGIYFESSRTKTWPRLVWFMDVLFAAPGSWNASFDGRIGIGHSDDDAFLGTVDQIVRDCFEQYLPRARSIAEFHDFAVGPERRFTFLNLDKYGLDHGTVLAALGRLDEAQAVLQASIAHWEERAKAEQRAEDELRLTRPRPRGIIVLRVGRQYMPIVEKLRELLALIEARNRPAIAALLHDWERTRVKTQQIEHLWEPTPFPLETGAGT